MLIISDLDGVGADMDGGLRQRWYLDHGHLPLPDTFDAWNWHKEFGSAHTKAFNTVLASSGFFRNLMPMPGWVEAMHRLKADGHDVLIATSPWPTSTTCWQDKIEWVGDQLGSKWRERVILTTDKTIIDGDYLIDDKPHIHGRRARPFWNQIVFDQPYNREVTGLRIMNWTDGSWEDVLYGLPDSLR